MIRYLLYFLTGGTVVTLTVLLAEMGHPIFSGMALVFPAITVISFYFIGASAGPVAVSTSAKSALLTSLVVWIPYVLIVIRYAPRWGVGKALLVGVLVFLIVGTLWVYLSRHFGLF